MKYTDNLNLFKYETEKDGKEVFSIDKCLNDNWDKIDAAYIKEEKEIIPFCFVSGPIDANGQPNIITTNGQSQIEENWEQPILTSEGSIGGTDYGVTASAYVGNSTYTPKNAFDGNSETYWLSNRLNEDEYLTFYSPVPIKPSQVRLRGQSGYAPPRSFEIQVSNDNSTWTTLYSGSLANSMPYDITCSANATDFYNYIRIYITSKYTLAGGNLYALIGEVTITGTYIKTYSTSNVVYFNCNESNPLKGFLANGESLQRNSIPNLDVSGLSDGEYNLFIGKDGQCIASSSTIYRQIKQPTPLKESTWSQPTITTNGVLGAGEFAVASTSVYDGQPYLAFDKNESTRYSENNSGGDLTIWSQIPIKIKDIEILNQFSNQYYYGFYGIQASNDGQNWITIIPANSTGQTANNTNFTMPVNSNNFYNYYKIIGTGSRHLVKEFYINATKADGTDLNNVIWLDTSCKPYMCYRNLDNTWQQFDYIPLPQTIKIKNHVITSINNITNYKDNGYDVGRNSVAGLCMPGNKIEQLTFGATGTSYTAPDNGYFTVRAQQVASSTYSQITLMSNKMMIRAYGCTKDIALYTYIPVTKGDIVTITYVNLNTSSSITQLAFVYTEGKSN